MQEFRVLGGNFVFIITKIASFLVIYYTAMPKSILTACNLRCTYGEPVDASCSLSVGVEVWDEGLCSAVDLFRLWWWWINRQDSKLLQGNTYRCLTNLASVKQTTFETNKTLNETGSSVYKLHLHHSACDGELQIETKLSIQFIDTSTPSLHPLRLPYCDSENLSSVTEAC